MAIIGLAALAALSMSACDDHSKAKKASSSTSQPATTASNLPPVPTVADLNNELTRALDPSVPKDQKLDMVQGAQADPNLADTLAQSYKQSGAKIQVTEVNSFGDTLNAKANFTIGNQTNVVDVPFVAEDGKWKVEKTWACTMLAQAQLQSKACAA